MSELSGLELTGLVAAAVLVGSAKTLGGVGLSSVALFVAVLPARESTGALLLLLVVGDVMAVLVHRRHADWPALVRLVRLVRSVVVKVVPAWPSWRWPATPRCAGRSASCCSCWSLLLDAALAPAVLVGAAVGLVVVKRIPQARFEQVVLALTVLAAVNLLR